jgi:hypothetical protein
MSKRSPNPRLAKTHRNYTVGEIAALYKVHKNTVLAWRGGGLTPIADRRKPLLFLGADLANFLETKRTRNKRPLRPGQIYCAPCHEAKEPAFGEAEYLQLNPNLRQSSRPLPNLYSAHPPSRLARDLATVQGRLKVTFTAAPLSIGDAVDPSVNYDFGAVETK